MFYLTHYIFGYLAAYRFLLNDRRVHILSNLGQACSRAQPLAWPVTVSEMGGSVNNWTYVYTKTRGSLTRPNVHLLDVGTTGLHCPLQLSVSFGLLHLLHNAFRYMYSL